MDEILALPAGPLARAALSLTQRTESTPVADHSIRSFLFARLLGSQDGSAGDAAYDENLLFAACTMHDLGLGTGAPGKERFEVEAPTWQPTCSGSTASRQRTSTESGRPSPCTAQ